MRSEWIEYKDKKIFYQDFSKNFYNSAAVKTELAEVLEVVPGREGSRDVFMLHEGTLYHFMFMPSVRDFPQAKNDVEELYNAVTQSFTFTSKKPQPLPTSATP